MGRTSGPGSRCNIIPLTGTVTVAVQHIFDRPRMQPYTPHGDSNVNATGDSVRVAGCNLIPLTGTVTRRSDHLSLSGLSDATLFLLRFADFCGAPTGACKNRSAAPAVPSLFRPLDALGAAAPHGDSNSILLMTVS